MSETRKYSKAQSDYLAAKAAFDAKQSDANRRLMYGAAFGLFDWAAFAILTLPPRPGQRVKIRKVVEKAKAARHTDFIFKEFVDMAMDLPWFV